MKKEKNGLSIRRIFQLLGIFFGILIIIIVALNVYGYFVYKAAIKQLQADYENAYNPPIEDMGELAPKDALDRLIDHGGDYNRPIIDAARLFVNKNGVVARSESKIEEWSWFWSVFGGFHGPYRIETTDWCIRLKFQFGQERIFAHTISQLAQMPHSDAIRLKSVNGESGLTPETAINYSDPESMNGLLVPIQTTAGGPSAKEITSTTWRILPDSAICAESGTQ